MWEDANKGDDLCPPGAPEREPDPSEAAAPPHFQIFPDGQYFHLRHRGMVQQSLTPHWGHRLRLKKDPKVSLAWNLPPWVLSHLLLFLRLF